MEETKPTSKSEPPAGTNPEGATRPPPPTFRADSGETERPPSAQRVNPGTNEPVDTDGNEELDEEVDPADKTADFDWEKLQESYHQAIDTTSKEEADLMDDWVELMKCFKIWAEAGHLHETDRTFSRLRTRIAYVQNSETRLESTRQHYVNVVQAFESALNLLRNSGLRG
ncbi:hypothetical protein K458DRAFT_308550 [Lentithecium fluviatile CBS 122367]|uniref:Uncharacterized protein n=1 Tax=Lentithecium fluviatile CBS 122367 TaxID=1168545 RepID=A0A6G1IUL6_9PLEO|nr:hypothetical protein K458DRAFT_308550 [Lentithecium fluviatile CBS 122367]